MKKILSVVVIVGALLSAACNSVAPDPGHEAVLVRKPILFGSGGVDTTPVKTGRNYVAPTTDYVLVDMRPQLAQVAFNDLMSNDGVPLDFESSVRWKFTDSVAAVSKFGVDHFFEKNVEQTYRNLVRDAVKKRGMNETAINASAAEAIDNEVTEGLRKYVSANQLPAELLDVTVGRANPPDAIKHQRTATAEQEQRANTEKQKKLAEDQRLEAERARAKADNAYREAMSLNPEQFIQLEQMKVEQARIHMQETACSKGGCTFIVGQTGTVPLLNVKQ